MAIYHLSVKVVSRSKGQSAVASAAYRSGDALTDEREGRTHDYTRRRGVEAANQRTADAEYRYRRTAVRPRREDPHQAAAQDNGESPQRRAGCGKGVAVENVAFCRAGLYLPADRLRVANGSGKALALLQKGDGLEEVANKTDLQRVVKRLRLRGIPIDEKRTAEPQRLCRTAGTRAFSGQPGLNVAQQRLHVGGQGSAPPQAVA